MEDNIQHIEFKDEFRECPVCGYPDGFHTMLKKEEERVKWLFICPSCHKVFDINACINPFEC